MAANDLALLAESVTFTHSGKVAPNRLGKSAMTERLCVWSDDEAEAGNRGQPTPACELFRHPRFEGALADSRTDLKLYEEWGRGAIGTIIVGNVPCDARFPEAKGNAIIDRDHEWDQVAGECRHA